MTAVSVICMALGVILCGWAAFAPARYADTTLPAVAGFVFLFASLFVWVFFRKRA